MNQNEAERVGVLLVGIAGMTASTTIAAALGLDDTELAKGSLIGDAKDAPETLPPISSLVFGGWDYDATDLLSVTRRHQILPASLISPKLRNIRAMPAICGAADVLEARQSLHRSDAVGLDEMTAVVADDIDGFRRQNAIRDVVLIYLGAPAAWSRLDDPLAKDLPVSQLAYALAAAANGAAFVDFTPNLTLEHPTVLEAFQRAGVPYCGRDGSTGQTLLKSVLYETLRERGLVVDGWYSTNLIGNNDGDVLAREEHAGIKIADKFGPLKDVANLDHAVRIEYFPPAGDNKEAWDAVYFHGLAGLQMSMRLNWQGRDSILAAPLVLDLARLMTNELRSSSSGYQSNLAAYFKRPVEEPMPRFSEALRRLRKAYPWSGPRWLPT